MAGPQKENGYTPIANEIMEAVARLQINATQFRILVIVWRYTYGFSRKEHTLSEGFIASATGIHRKQIGRELVDLIKRNILTEIKAPSFSSTRVLAFNKHYDSWQGTKTLTVNENVDQTGIGLVDPPGIGLVDQDKQDLKQNIKIVHELFENLWKIYPEKKGKSSVTDKKKKELFKHGYDVMAKCIKRYEEYVQHKRKNGFPDLQYKNGSTFFNGGYVDYLDENYQEKTIQTTKRSHI